MTRIKKRVHPITNMLQAPTHPRISSSMADSRGRQICVRRIDSEPNMFYSIEINGRTPEEPERRTETNIEDNVEDSSMQSDSNTANILLVAKTALNMNYIVILYCIISLPRAIMAIIYRNCEQENGDCHYFLMFSKFMIPIRLTCILFGFFVFLYKFKKDNS